jgi:hypothetical protein
LHWLGVQSMIQEVVQQLSGALLVRMLHTRDGAKVGVTCVMHGSNKVSRFYFDAFTRGISLLSVNSNAIFVSVLPLRCLRSVEFEAVSGTCPIVETIFQLILMGLRYCGNIQMCSHVN